ncbi:MAG: MBL fold metallo-hydrolase [Bacillota bacterium]|nr:MBL fold metallo-hydrolase [Bacillota bacterium]
MYPQYYTSLIYYYQVINCVIIIKKYSKGAIKLNFCTLFSGSSGNCVYIQDGNVRFLVDAGKNMKAVASALQSLDTRLEDINGIFITHEHSDHISALGVIAKRYNMPIFGRRATLEAVCDKINDIMPDRLTVLDGDGTFDIFGIGVTPFKTPHDTPDSSGYVFTGSSEKTLAIATDLGVATDEVFHHLCKADFAIVESNHDIEMLKNGPYPWYLKNRVISDHGHLSNDACADLVCRLTEHGVLHFLLAHLSANNNTEKLALNTTCCKLLEKGIKPGETTVNLAPRSNISTIFDF